jgi:hypothetical protein
MAKDPRVRFAALWVLALCEQSQRSLSGQQDTMWGQSTPCEWRVDHRHAHLLESCNLNHH